MLNQAFDFTIVFVKKSNYHDTVEIRKQFVNLLVNVVNTVTLEQPKHACSFTEGSSLHLRELSKNNCRFRGKTASV